MKTSRYCRKFVSTVDVDFEEISKTEIEMLKLRLDYICRSSEVECTIADTSRGIHVYIRIRGKCYDFWKSFVLRSLLFDDKTRMDFDMSRYERGAHRWIETLFKRKAKLKTIGWKTVVLKTSSEATPSSFFQPQGRHRRPQAEG